MMISNMLTGLSIKSWAIIGLSVAFMGLSVLSYWYYKDSQNQISILNQNNATLKANQTQLEQSIKEQNKLIIDMKKDWEDNKKRIDELNESSSELRLEVKELEEKFSKHNLKKLSSKKPKLIENIINKATDEVFNEIEDITNNY